MIEEFVARQIALGDSVRLAHWAAKGAGSYARHVALGEFYNQQSDKLDMIVEIYQGCYGLIGNVEPIDYAKDGIESQITDEANWIATNRDNLASGNNIIENQFDELGAFYARTVYKLRFLA